nr:MAG TPA: hypothetical protein [Caudoviricetes sp.]
MLLEFSSRHSVNACCNDYSNNNGCSMDTY